MTMFAFLSDAERQQRQAELSRYLEKKAARSDASAAQARAERQAALDAAIEGADPKGGLRKAEAAAGAAWRDAVETVQRLEAELVAVEAERPTVATAAAQQLASRNKVLAALEAAQRQAAEAEARHERAAAALRSALTSELTFRAREAGDAARQLRDEVQQRAAAAFQHARLLERLRRHVERGDDL